MPAVDTMAPSFDNVGLMLRTKILRDHPDWRQCVDSEAEGNLRLFVPAPNNPSHHLEIVQRGGSMNDDTIEVAYDLGLPWLRAEAQFIFSLDDADEATSEVAAFVQSVCEGDVVVVEESLGPIVRALRRDGARTLARFRTRQEVDHAPRERYSVVHRWT